MADNRENGILFLPLLLLQYELQYAPPIADGVKIAYPMNTLILNAWYLLNFEASEMHSYIDQCLYFKAVTIDFYVSKAMSPEGIIAIAQIAETRPEQDVYQ